MHTLSVSTQLSETQIEEIYRYQKNKYQIGDAKAHYSDYNDKDDVFPRSIPNEKDYQNMVDTYNKQHDCNIAENDLWESIVATYFVEL